MYGVRRQQAVHTGHEHPQQQLYHGRIKLSMDFVSGASYYNVYRADSERGTYNLLAKGTKVSDTVFTDGTSGKAGNTYWYKVSAVDVNGAELSDKSGAVSRVSKCQRPTGLKAAANDDGSVTLTWDKPAIAGSVSGYRVYMWNDGAFEWIGGGLKTVGHHRYRPRAVHHTGQGHKLFRSRL